MAQLRDAQTSEVVFEGSPYEVALMADKLGPTNVIFDDVGLEFDPEAVKTHVEDDVAGLTSVINSTNTDVDADTKASAQSSLDVHTERQANVDASVSGASAALEEARAKVEG